VRAATRRSASKPRRIRNTRISRSSGTSAARSRATRNTRTSWRRTCGRAKCPVSATTVTACSKRSTRSARACCALALHIDLPETYFDDKTNFGNSILRPIHYPPITTPDVPNVRAGAHEDINLITLLVGASAQGLEVLSRKGEWVPFTADADTIVVNIGDMLQRLTNHVYPSTTHRVTNPPGDAARQPRYSVPFFLHPNPDFMIDALPSCISADNPNRYPQPISAHEYLQERLREIKLI
jgi:isopenicillin N synthase-like dioxygenase